MRGKEAVMGRMRKTLRFMFSFGGYDGLSPIAKESETNRLLREQNEILSGRRPSKKTKNPYVYDWDSLFKKK